MIDLQCIKDLDSLRELEPDWNPLLDRSRSSSMFLTWECISSWWEVFGEDYELLVLVAREGVRILGVAPLMVGRGTTLHTRPFRTLMFIGQNPGLYPEYMDCFVEPGREDEVMAAFAGQLSGERKDDWDVMLLRNVLIESPNLAELRRVLRAAEVEVSLVREMSCSYVDLSPHLELPPEQRWDSYLKSRSKRFRKNVRGYSKRLARDFEVDFSVLQDQQQVTRTLDTLLDFNLDRWSAHEAAYRTREYQRFHHLLSSRMLAQGQLLLARLALDGEVVAVEYSFVHGGKVYGYQMGRKTGEPYDKAGVGNVLNGEVIRWALEQGLREYDFMGGWEMDYKRRWSSGTRVAIDLEGFPRTLMGRAYRLGYLAKEMVKAGVPADAWNRLRERRDTHGLRGLVRRRQQ